MTHATKSRGSLRVGVLRGGPSHEYDISLQSGSHVIRSLKDNYSVIDIVISRDGVWHVEGREKTPGRILPQIDVVFNALHGNYGEDGKVQRILEQYGVPYTGSRPMPSALSLNKILTQKHLSSQGIQMPTSTSVGHAEHTAKLVAELFRLFPQPSIIKPSVGGSSLGVTVAFTFEEFARGIETALRFAPVAIVEEYIVGDEISCVVIDGDNGASSYALNPVGVAVKNTKHFSYEMKCDPETKTCIVNADLSPETKQTVQEAALHAHKTLGLRHYSASDFIVSPKRGVYLLEVNSLPGLTPQSLLPHSLETAGISLGDFVSHTIDLAFLTNSR
jgi:D-alanine-D-alanine ligase